MTGPMPAAKDHREVRYAVGPWYLIVAPAGMVMVPEDVPRSALTDLRAALQQTTEDDGPGRVLSALTLLAGSGFRDLTPFGVVVVRTEGVDVALRGGVDLEVDGRRLDGRGVSSWREERFAGAEVLRLGVEGADTAADTFPLVGGIVPAAWVTVSGSEGVPEGKSESRSEVGSAGRGERRRAMSVGATLVSGTLPSAPSPPAPLPAVEPPASPPPQSPIPAPSAAADSAAPEAPGEHTAKDYAGLWGATVMHPLEAAAVREFTEAEPAPASSSVPGRIEVPDFAQPATPQVTPANRGDHDQLTVTSEELQAARGAGGPPAPASGNQGPTALSLVCAAGHPNAPRASVCRRCGAALSGPAQVVPRPSMGTLRLPSGETVDLERSVILGRKPHLSRVSSADAPLLQRLPGQEISRNHVEIRLEEWNVLAVDLASRNGTVLIRDGQAPRRLSQNDPIPLRAGDVLDLGEGVMLRLEDLP